MALSQSVNESLKDAESALRNALAYAARNEKPYVSKEISDMIFRIDAIIKSDKFIDMMNERMKGSDGKGLFDLF